MRDRQILRQVRTVHRHHTVANVYHQDYLLFKEESLLARGKAAELISVTASLWTEIQLYADSTYGMLQRAVMPSLLPPSSPW